MASEQDCSEWLGKIGNAVSIQCLISWIIRLSSDARQTVSNLAGLLLTSLQFIDTFNDALAVYQSMAMFVINFRVTLLQEQKRQFEDIMVSIQSEFALAQDCIPVMQIISQIRAILDSLFQEIDELVFQKSQMELELARLNLDIRRKIEFLMGFKGCLEIPLLANITVTPTLSAVKSITEAREDLATTLEEPGLGLSENIREKFKS